MTGYDLMVNIIDELERSLDVLERLNPTDEITELKDDIEADLERYFETDLKSALMEIEV